MYYGGESNVPGAPGNLMAGGPSFDIPRNPGALGGRSGEQLKRLYEGGTQQNQQLNDELMRRGIMPGSGPQLPLSFGAPGAIGNMGGIASQIPQGPNTPLPSPGWNPGMIKAPGNPNFRPSPMWERPGPTPGSTIPWNASLPAGFQNKIVS